MSLNKVINYLRERKPQRTWSELGGQNSSGGGRKLILMANVSFTNSNGQHLAWHQKQVFEGPISYTKMEGSWRCFKAGSLQGKRGAIFQCIFPVAASLQLQPKPLHYWSQKIKVWRKRGCWKQEEMVELNLIKWPPCIVCFSGYV